ncbi:MAG: glycosyltransferase family 1 protein [Pseudomonadota bacterium]
MHIGIDARPMQASRKAGIAVYTTEVLNHLQDEVTLFTARALPPDAIPVGSRRVNYDVLPLPSQRFGLRTLWENLLLPRSIRSSKVDLFWGPRFFVPHRSKVPCVATIHDIAFVKYPEIVSKQQYRHFDSLIRMSVRCATHFIAVSKTTRDDFCQHYGVNPDRVSVVHNGVNQRYRIALSTESKDLVKARLGIPDQFILFTGTIEPRKNLDRLLSAYHRSDAFKKAIPLVIAGKSGWLQSNLFDNWGKLLAEKSIILLGYVSDDDLAALYQSCLFFALPSLYEGFGIPVLEAMSSGAPVLTSDNSAMQELYAGSAMTVDPFSVEALSDGINQMLIEETRAELISRGLALSARFSWEQSAAEHRNVFERVLS